MVELIILEYVIMMVILFGILPGIPLKMINVVDTYLGFKSLNITLLLLMRDKTGDSSGTPALGCRIPLLVTFEFRIFNFGFSNFSGLCQQRLDILDGEVKGKFFKLFLGGYAVIIPAAEPVVII